MSVIMNDKEVGDLWKYFWELNSDGLKNRLAMDGIQLIRKLVDERAKYIHQVLELSGDYTQDALCDFGIPPKEWNDGK